MLPVGRALRWLLAVLLVLCVFPALAAVQDGRLSLPTMAASAASAADWASTDHALTHDNVREMNPLLRPYLAIHNLRNERKAERRKTSGDSGARIAPR